MRLAVFYNQFPGRVTTFFARDMRGLLESGIDIDVFAIYPLQPKLWQYVPNILNEKQLPRDKVHHTSLTRSLRHAKPWPLPKFGRFLRDGALLSASALQFGIRPLAKTVYVLLEAWEWAQEYPAPYDHILAYWGNYSASCAYVYHRLAMPQIPFSIFLHAGMDLYSAPLYLQQKLLYADNIITCCDFNLQFMRKRFQHIFHRLEDKLYVHPHGLDFEEFAFVPEARPSRKVIAVGRLEKQKGFDYLLYAVHQLLQQNVEIELELVGEGSESNALRKLVDELQIAHKVRFRGWLTFDEVRNAMRQSTIMAHPSPDLGDGVPNVIKEAIALGTPVVASNVAGIPELLDDGRCGMLVPPRDIRALAQAIDSLLADEAMRQRYAEAARKHAENKYDLWRNGQHLAERLRSTTRLAHTASSQQKI